jgi:hypothetical protein
MVRSMPIRDRGSGIDDTPLEKIDDRLTAIEDVIAAQARSTRDLTSRIEDFQSAIKVVQTIQDDFRTQRATREAWASIMKTIQWVVVIIASMVGAIAAYIGMHAGKS